MGFKSWKTSLMEKPHRQAPWERFMVICMPHRQIPRTHVRTCTSVHILPSPNNKPRPCLVTLFFKCQ